MKNKWLISRLFNLGDKFSWKSLFDRTKRSFVEFLVVFSSILISLGVEKQGNEFEQRKSNIENIKSVRDEICTIQSYTEDYFETNAWVTEWFNEQYERWDNDSDSTFVDSNGDIPMKMFFSREPFSPKRIVFDAIKLDGTFRLLDKDLGRSVKEIYDGANLKYLIRNSEEEEKEIIKSFRYRLNTAWAQDLGSIDIDTIEFWLKNRAYIQRDKVMKHILLERIRNWIYIKSQLQSYKVLLDKNLVLLEKKLSKKESETVILWWWF